MANEFIVRNGLIALDNSTITGSLTVTAPTGSDSTSLGSELLTSTNWTTTGWTGDFIAGFTHTPGNTDVLSHTLAAVNSVLYVIQWTITNRTAGGITITFGGKSNFATGTNKFGLRATTTGNFTITPTSDFNGTVVLSVKVANIYPALISIVNSSGGSQPLEIRATQNASNTFMGYLTGARNLGVNNTVYGYNSLTSNSTGNFITTIGSGIFSGASFPGNAYNVGIGGSIGNTNFSGDINTFIGWNIGTESITTTASSNIAIGYMAFRGNGNSNTIIGNHINRPTGSFSQNVNIGDLSMFSHTTGNQNTSLGFQSGRFIADGTTANTITNNSVFLGSGTRAQADNQTNQIVIGHNAIGLGSNTAVLGNDSITFTGLKGNVGVNTTTNAGFRLDVNGTARIVGATRIDNLAGTGTRMVVADANGVMSTQALGIAGSGTTNYLAKFTAGGTVGDSGIFESGGNVGIGTTSPGQKLDIVGNCRINGSLFVLNNNSLQLWGIDNGNYIDLKSSDGDFRIRTNLTGTPVDAMRITSGGNLLINTTTDAGFRLDVNGTARVQGELTVGNGTDSIIRANSSTGGSFSRLNLISNTTNFSTMLDIRPNGTNTSLTGFYLRDSSTAASGTNIVFFGRGDATLPSTGVSYLGAIVSGQIISNSLHLGFLVSNTSSGRIEAVRIWNSGNVYLQKGGTFTDVASAILNVNSTTQGFLPPRMTATQRNAITSPAAGLIVYDTTLNKLSLYTGLVWETITST